jgi:hypothetical protein
MRRSILLLVVCTLTLPPALAQTEATLCRWLFQASTDFTATARSAIELAAQATFGASEFTGSLPTLTGTLTETSPDVWNYSSSPGTKLVIVFYGGGTVEYTFTHWEGFTDKGWENFVDSHHMTFTTTIPGSLNLSIDSDALPVVGGGKTTITRVINGTLLYYGATTTVSLNHTGTKEWTVDVGYAEYYYQEQCSGTASNAGYQATINDQYYKHLIHNSNSGVHASNTGLLSNSSVFSGGSTYAYHSASVEWAAWTDLLDSAAAGVYNMVADPSFWTATGTLTKNGAPFGTVQFSGPVIQNTSGPVLMLSVTGGSYLIHPLLQWWLTGIEDAPEGLPVTASLMQNYPNPFNPETVVRYAVPAASDVRLVVYDMLGREVAVLASGKHMPGIYEVHFDGSGLASGVYLYSLTAGDFVQTRKMVLTK